MAGLGLMTRRRAIQASPTQGGYIRFADPEVLRVLMSNGVSSDGIGITPEDAAAVTDIGTWFANNTTIEYFDEFERFVNVTYLGYSNSTYRWAFAGCTSLKSITLPPNLTKLFDGQTGYGGIGAFYGCTSLIHVGNIENLKYIGTCSFYNCTSLAYDELNLENLTSLGQNAFYDVNIRKLNLGALTVAPGSYFTASRNFGNKGVLEEVVLPQTLTTIGNGAFYRYINCVIEDLNLPNLTTLGGGAFNGTKLRRITSLGSVTALPNNSNNTGDVFGNCTELTYISQDVLDRLTYLATAFAGCTNLVIEELRLPSLTGNLTAGFAKCVIKKVADLGNITGLFSNDILANNTFPLGTEVEELTVPSTVTDIGRYAFTGMSKCEAFIMLPTIPPTLNTLAFYDSPEDCPIYVPDGSVTAYQEATNWSTYADRIRPLSDYTE